MHVSVSANNAVELPLFASFATCHKTRKMTNRIAVILGATILVILALDMAFSAGIAVFLGRKFLDLISLVAIWR